MKRLKPFGNHPDSWMHGLNLPSIIGMLETLLDSEEDRIDSLKGPISKRCDIVKNALDLLRKAAEPEESE